MWSYYSNAEVPDIAARVIYWQGRFYRDAQRFNPVNGQDLTMVGTLLEDLLREIEAMRKHIKTLEGGDT